MFTWVVFLGYHLAKERIRPKEDKNKVLKEKTYPCDIKGVRQFLGFVNFLHHFIPKYSLYTSRLSSLLRKLQMGWKRRIPDTAQVRFDYLKNTLLDCPTLNNPVAKKILHVHGRIKGNRGNQRTDWMCCMLERGKQDA